LASGWKASGGIETLSRIDRLGVDRHQLLIRLVIAQRLVGVLCPSCKTGREVSEHERQLLSQFKIPYQPGQIVYEKRGCAHEMGSAPSDARRCTVSSAQVQSGN
jgi:type II secretory ATPase GspE/PulE/Tfp pilus assembly ATPase PilB-like protein